jgi:hypothetical protein
MAEKLDEEKLKAILSEEIASAENYARSELTPDRQMAINYYNGNVVDVPFVAGRSRYISRDVSNVVGWTLPDIMRVFTASDRIVDCLPETEKDEETSDQAADYLNFCFWRDNPGYQIMWDATWDALVTKDGIVKQYWDVREECKYSTYTGMDENEIAILLSDDGVEEVERSEPYSEMVPVEIQVPAEPTGPASLVDLAPADHMPQEPMQEVPQPSAEEQGGGEPAPINVSAVPQDMGQGAPAGQASAAPEMETQVEMQPVLLYDIKIKRTTKKGRLAYLTIRPECFLTDAAAVDLVHNWRFQAEKAEDVTRSDLIKMGFDRDRVDSIPSFNAANISTEDLARRNLAGTQYDNPEKSMEKVDLYECYIKFDINDDGMAEIVKVMYAGNSGGSQILDWEEWDDETPYDKIPCNPVPHRLYSDSLADEVKDIQKFKTVLGRQMFDNMYQTNMPQPVVLEKNILNMDAVVNRQIGVPIIVKNMDAIRWDTTPFIGDKVLLGLQYLDSVIEMRTGVSRSATSLDPDALQNQTATAVQATRDSAHSQVELIARNQAELGWKKVFQKSLKIIVKNQDRPRTIRLRDEWVDMDPRQWNTGMDIIINVGLGTGSRDRDMAMLNTIQQSQIMDTDRLATSGFTSQAIDMLPKIIKTQVKIAEAAGVKSPDDFYPSLTPDDLAAMKKQVADQAGQPSAAEQAAKAKLDAEMQMQQAEMAMKQQQSQEDNAIKAQQNQANNVLEQQKMAMEYKLKQEQLTAEIGLKREQLIAELQLKREQMNAELEMQRQSMTLGANSHPSFGGGAVSSGVHLGGDAG